METLQLPLNSLDSNLWVNSEDYKNMFYINKQQHSISHWHDAFAAVGIQHKQSIVLHCI